MREFTRCNFLLIILLTAAACQPSSVPSQATDALPTRFVLPGESSPEPDLPPTRSLRAVPTQAVTIPAASPTPVATAALITMIPPSPQFAPTSPGENTSQGTLLTPLPDVFSFGRTARGSDLIAWRLGTGPARLLLVGGIHAGFESNTVALVEALLRHFQANPGDVLPGMTLVLIPVLNADGYVLGRTLEGRFNARGVDLNRNWGCGWSSEAVFRNLPVNPGERAFSEPETTALAALINDLRPAGVLFYHSAANGVFAGACEGDGVSGALAAIIGDATGYPYGDSFADYVVTGTAANWVDGVGIPAADVELATAQGTEFERNLRGVMVLQCWALGAASAGLPACEG